MFPKFRVAALAAAAVGGPYVASETDLGRDAVSMVTQPIRGSDSAAVTPAGSQYANHALHDVEQIGRNTADRYRYDDATARKLGALGDGASSPGLTGAPVQDLREVLRFDISPDWVIARFARVSTVLADLRLEGLRVPVVTGTRADDFAGTLTYYFDARGKLQRATLHGFTGDPSRLTAALTSHYQMTPRPSLEAGVYAKTWNGLPVHFLRLGHAPVIYSDAVHHKYTVFLELNDPNLAYGISAEARRIVDSDRSTGRW